MAVQLNLAADNRSATARQRPIDQHGKERFLYSKFTLAAQADINSTLNCGAFPAGTVRVLPYTARVLHSAWGAGALFSLGHDAYRASYNYDGGANPNDVAANYTAFFAAQDFSASIVTATPPAAAAIKWDLSSMSGVTCMGRITGANAPAAATMEVIIGYLYE
jgi:hypothetical protein